MEWWGWLILAGCVLVYGAYVYVAGMNDGYKRGRADGWDQRKALYR